MRIPPSRREERILLVFSVTLLAFLIYNFAKWAVGW